MKPCVTVSSNSESCVTARVEKVVKPCVTVSSESKPCVTAQVESGSEPSETTATKGEPSIITRVEESGKGISETKKGKILVSWQSSSSEDGSDPESESEVEQRMSNLTGACQI